MKYYKLKTVVFYIFATTIISFDLKASEEGSENENEGICSCCCSDEGKKKIVECHVEGIIEYLNKQK